MNKILATARRHWRPLAALNLAILACAGGVAAFWPRTWTAQAQLILPTLTGQLDASLGPLGHLGNGNLTFSSELSPTAIQASILTSTAVLERAHSTDPAAKRYPRLDDYRRLFKTTVRDQSTIIVLEAKGSTPAEARTSAHALIDAYQRRLFELRSDDARLREQFGETNRERAKRTLEAAQRAIADFKKRTGVVDSAEQLRGVVASLTSLTAERARVEAQARAARTRTEMLAGRLGMAPERAIASLRLGENRDFQIAREKLAQVETALAQARGVYTEKSERVRSLVMQREALLAELKRRIRENGASGADATLGGSPYRDGRIDLIVQLVGAEGEAAALASQAARLDSPLSRLRADLGRLAGHQVQLWDLQRRYEIAEGVYKGLLAQVEQAKVNAFDAYPNVQSLDPPAVDREPTSPKPWLVFLGALVACASGSGALLILCERRNPLLSPLDLEAVGAPVLARVPQLGHELAEAEAEVAFARLASEVSLLPLDHRRLLITSATLAEGKTTTALGLAQALRRLGYRVLTVDGDLQRGELSRRLALTDGDAPTDWLSPDGADATTIGAYVASGAFLADLERAQSEGAYDFVIVDAPPVSLTGEAAPMAAAVGSVLFVVRPGVSDRDSTDDSLARLARHGVRVAGLVVNGVTPRGGAYRYRYATS